MQILSFLSLILFALPALAQTAQPDWIADPRTGCRVWNETPQPNETISWSGGCENGIAHGGGVLQWFKDGKPTARYEGEYRDGKRNGRGVQTFASGNRYEGEYRDDKRNGRGVQTMADGNRYDGEFRDGNFNGRGVYTWASGNRYEGDFRDDKQHGRGAYTWPTGARYEGEYRDGKQNGRGVYTWPTGERYEGEYQDDKRNGRGVHTFADGKRYEGEYRNDRPHGFGTLVVGGETYSGTWTNGCLRDGNRTAWVIATKKECGFE